jgi:hypothetical protein
MSGEDHPDNDVDLLADFPPGLSVFELGRLEADLEGILGACVDLIPAADRGSVPCRRTCAPMDSAPGGHGMILTERRVDVEDTTCRVT